MAIGAHPDDIEFYMAGTLLLLGKAGFELHYMNLSSGSCGSVQHNAAKTRTIRRKESQAAARILGAHFHPSLTDDLEILYELRTLRRLAAIIREVRPAVLLTHPPQDYMEDHTNTCRLAVTAAFARGMPNFRTSPRRRAVEGLVTVYHAMPHGLCDPLRSPVLPDFILNTESVHEVKRRALAAHHSQKAWLDASQGMDSYLKVMDGLSQDVARLSRRVRLGEGWRRHLHYGFCSEQDRPLEVALARFCHLPRARRSAQR